MGRSRWLAFAAVMGIACGESPGGGVGSLDAGPANTDTGGGATASCEGAPDGQSCDDGDPCTEEDVCRAEACVGVAKRCTTELACHEATCNAATGSCEAVPVDDGVACDDGDLCTLDDRCVAGSCEGGEDVACDGSSTCTVGACNPATGQCEGEPAEDGVRCSNECMRDGFCRAGECVGGRRELCESGGDCRESLGCDPLLGCQYDNEPDGTACDDESECTNRDRCASGACVGREIVCPEAPPCKASICDPDVGCTLVDLEDGLECDDGDLCTLESLCEAGECIATEEVRCPARPCMVDNRCNPETGRCDPQFEPEGTACDDRNLCTEGETCLCNQEECDTLSCSGGTPIPWTGQPCSEGICFTDVTASAGITWSSKGHTPHGHAAGGVMADFDGDGWLDLLLASEAEPMTLYINDQTGGFSDETAFAGFTPVNKYIGVATSSDTWQSLAAADYDADGDLDLYVSFNGPNFLLENDGAAHFIDVTAGSGAQDTRWSTGATFGDLDEDDDLDLVVGNYIAKQGSFFPNHIAIDNSVFRNNGDGTFTDIAATLNIGGAGTGKPGASLLTYFTDFDQDGDADLMECNDFGQTVEPNKLYENDGTGKFTEVGASLNADVELFCMGIAQSDYDRDLDFDYYHTSIGHHALLTATPNGFRDRARTTGTRLENDDCLPHKKQAGWGTLFEDFDNDGWQDLFVTNGYIVAATSISNPPKQEKKLLKNTATGTRFVDVSKSAGIADRGPGRGVLAGDYDQDGDVDLVVINMNGDPILYRNDSPTLGSYMTIELEGRTSNPFAPNAIVTADFADFTALREYGVRHGYTSISPTEVYIGADDHDVAERVTIDWPSGIESRLLSVPTNARTHVLEPDVTITDFEVTRPLKAGVSLTATATLTNHVSKARTVDLDVELWDADDTVLASKRTSQDVRGATAKRITLTVTAPSSLPSGALRWVASVSDSEGATDQVAVEP